MPDCWSEGMEGGACCSWPRIRGARQTACAAGSRPVCHDASGLCGRPRALRTCRCLDLCGPSHTGAQPVSCLTGRLCWAGVRFLGGEGALVSCSADRTVKLWSADAEGAFTAAAVFQARGAPAPPRVNRVPMVPDACAQSPEMRRCDSGQLRHAGRARVATASRATCLFWLQRVTCRACWRPSDCPRRADAAQDHSDEVTAVTVHATGDYIVTASLDRTWAFYDLQAQICLTQVGPEAVRHWPPACPWSFSVVQRMLKTSPC